MPMAATTSTTMIPRATVEWNTARSASPRPWRVASPRRADISWSTIVAMTEKTIAQHSA